MCFRSPCIIIVVGAAVLLLLRAHMAAERTCSHPAYSYIYPCASSVSRASMWFGILHGSSSCTDNISTLPLSWLSHQRRYALLGGDRYACRLPTCRVPQQTKNLGLATCACALARCLSAVDSPCYLRLADLMWCEKLMTLQDLQNHKKPLPIYWHVASSK